jgi:hypothetical protein
MRTLPFALLIALFILPHQLVARERLYLLTDSTATSCSIDCTVGQPVQVLVAYVPNEGPNGIKGLEFRVKATDNRVLILSPVFWRSEFVATGWIETGVQLISAECVQAESNILFIGYFTILPLVTFTNGTKWLRLEVFKSEYDSEPNILYVIGCDPESTKYEIFAWWFGLPFEACWFSPVEQYSWGAIKSLYR